MTFHILDNYTVTTASFTLDGDDDLLLLPGATLVGSGVEAIVVSGTGQSITVLGTTYTNGSAAQGTIEIFSSDNELYIGQDGFIGNATTGAGSVYVFGNDNIIVNDGAIAAGSAITLAGATGTTIINNGTISSLDTNALDIQGGTNRVENFGDIRGDIFTLSGELTIVNGGTISQNIFFDTGDDSYTGVGTGVVTGAVMGGSGNDTLRGSEAADSLDGGADSDLINGRGGDDTLLGDTGADTIFGGDGDDNIDGEVNNDLINGNAGDDTILGSGGDDTLRGGRDDDELRGGSGADNIRGDSGDDLIIGGGDRDDMFGGAGNDVFLFENVNDSGTGAVRDRIYDFRSGEDVLDINQLAGPQFQFLGSANFTGSGAREVRAVTLSNGTLIYIDTDGDGTRDSDIFLIGTASVTEGDFLL